MQCIREYRIQIGAAMYKIYISIGGGFGGKRVLVAKTLSLFEAFTFANNTNRWVFIDSPKTGRIVSYHTTNG